MHLVNRAAIVTALFGLMAAAVPAFAQYGSIRLPGRVSDTERAKNSSISIYPGATFIVSGNNNTTALSGILIGADTGASTNDGKWTGEIGGWYFFHESQSDLRELHIKAFYNRQFGLQFGVLGANAVKATFVDGFFVYNYENKRGRAWGAQAGIGFFNQPSFTGLSFFAQAALPLTSNLDLNGSYWYVNDNVADVHRLALGVAIHF
jgi:hypothetical protein